MPPARSKKCWAAQVGRDGPRVYKTWEECKAATERFSGALYKKCSSESEAEIWAASGASSASSSSSSGQNPAPQTPTHAPATSYRRPPAPFTIPSPASAPQQAAESSSNSPKPQAPAPAAPVVPKLVLSREQRQVLQMVRGGRSVFFTGSAGTGKSVLLREIIKDRENLQGRHTIGVTASTGIAGVNIGGVTIHSWGGIGIGQETAKKIAAKLLGQKTLEKTLRRWVQAKTLIIDEISMLSGDLFDKLEEIARIVRFDDRPFGGIQLVLSGDFCQLPPVPDRPDTATGKQKPVVFAFDAKSWNGCVGAPVELVKVFRQKDQKFVDMLNCMRMGKMTAEMITTFQCLSRKVEYKEGPEPTELFAKRMEVSTANGARIKNLAGAGERYRAIDSPGLDSKGYPITIDQMQRLLERLVATEELILKIGAQVMLIKNLVQGQLVNGSVGIVTQFSTPKEALQAHFEIATAVDPKADKDKDKKNDGQAPVEPLSNALPERKYPVVEFKNGMKMLMVPADFTVENAEAGVEASRIQIPLILAWALSIHKSQGMSIDRLKVNLSSIFEKGQAYVALSRATSLDTLQVLNFNPTRVMAHERVLEWHEGFQAQEDYIMVDSD